MHLIGISYAINTLLPRPRDQVDETLEPLPYLQSKRMVALGEIEGGIPQSSLIPALRERTKVRFDIPKR